MEAEMENEMERWKPRWKRWKSRWKKMEKMEVACKRPSLNNHHFIVPFGISQWYVKWYKPVEWR
jgi:hypothetical protein